VATPSTKPKVTKGHLKVRKEVINVYKLLSQVLEKELHAWYQAYTSKSTITTGLRTTSNSISAQATLSASGSGEETEKESDDDAL